MAEHPHAQGLGAAERSAGLAQARAARMSVEEALYAISWAAAGGIVGLVLLAIAVWYVDRNG